jgi:dihydrofolate reductase
MRKLISFMHVSLDGFVAGVNGEMDWIKVDPEMFELAGKQTDRSDTALYGRVTYEVARLLKIPAVAQRLCPTVVFVITVCMWPLS